MFFTSRRWVLWSGFLCSPTTLSRKTHFSLKRTSDYYRRNEPSALYLSCSFSSARIIERESFISCIKRLFFLPALLDSQADLVHRSTIKKKYDAQATTQSEVCCKVRKSVGVRRPFSLVITRRWVFLYFTKLLYCIHIYMINIKKLSEGTPWLFAIRLFVRCDEICKDRRKEYMPRVILILSEILGNWWNNNN